MILLVLVVAGCNPSRRNITPPEALTVRDGADPMNAVETYLQEYQPGKLPRLFQTTHLYDRHGVLLAEAIDEGRRTWVALDKISIHLINATVATEDASFFVNSGVDPLRIARALLSNAQEGQIVSGTRPLPCN